MDSQTFQTLLTEEVKTYKPLLETNNNDWIVNTTDARTSGIGKPRYHNLETYKKYLDRQQSLQKKISRR